MTWQIPTWYGTILLALAAYRVWRILAEDTILDRPRDRWFPEGAKRTEFIGCPWCLGAWVAIAWTILWWWQPHWTLVVAFPFALSTVVGGLAMLLDAQK